MSKYERSNGTAILYTVYDVYLYFRLLDTTNMSQ